MKIGIVTFHKTINYGAVLQAYALQTKLQQMGHDPFFIDNNITENFIRWDAWISRTPLKTIQKIVALFRSFTIIKNFKLFQNKYLQLDKQKYHGIETLQKNPPMADVYICGSDQIWNYNWVKKKNEQLFWLGFGSIEIKRIAYAASFAVTSIPVEIAIRYANYAKKISAISVREKSAVDILKSMGITSVECVFDPTLLLETKYYETIEEPFIKPTNPYCFYYQLGDDTKKELNKIKKQITKQYSLEVHNATCTSFSRTVNYGPGRWLTVIKNSDFVLTDSYHAVIFSLIYQKEFIVVLRKGRHGIVNSRITSILAQFDLVERAIDQYNETIIEKLYNKRISWSNVNSVIEKEREHSVGFLKRNLSDKT